MSSRCFGHTCRFQHLSRVCAMLWRSAAVSIYSVFDFDLHQSTPAPCWTYFQRFCSTHAAFSMFAYLWSCNVFFLDLEMLLRCSFPPSNLCFCFQLDRFGAACWLLGAIPLPAHISPSQVRPDMIFPACEIQSKQQLAMFSSLCFSADPLLKACSSLWRNPGDIPTHCFSDTH